MKMNKNKKIYGKKYKSQLNSRKLNHYYKKELNNKEKRINLIKNKKLTRNIIELPSDIQKKIFIYSMKKFYKKDYILPINKIPIWYSHQIEIQKQISDCYLKNIHFLHLEMNTLPENKKYILGCQCNFCINHKDKNKYNHLINNYQGISYIDEDIFIKYILGLDSDNYWVNFNYWYQFENDDGLPIFNPLYDKWKQNFFKKSSKNYQKQI